jgi:ubiquinone/menaquinone biosynthesis C-methylase UbiE/uncharacterized protein YbaR (Trm112 family)
VTRREQIQAEPAGEGAAGSGYELYACPACRSSLDYQEARLHCSSCGESYPVVDGIPDFILEDLSQSEVPLLQWANSHYDQLAPVYERMRYPWRLLLHAGLAAPSLGDLVRLAADAAAEPGALVLDVACGPATIGRRIASRERQVYGIDVSMGMLRQGQAYLQAGGSPGVHLARAKVERLPFADGRFDAAVCAAALHLFADPFLALAEIGRCLVPGGRLAVQTMSAEPRGIFRFKRVRKAAHSRGSHLFRLEELEAGLEQAGFTGFRPQVFGSIIVFQAARLPGPLEDRQAVDPGKGGY